MEEQHRTHAAFPSGRKKVLESQKNQPVTKAEYQTMQTHSFLDKVYDGKQMNLFGQIHGMGILKMILLQFR